MRKHHIHFTAETKEEIAEELKETAFILAGYHEALKNWMELYGGEKKLDAKKRVEFWAKRAEEWSMKHRESVR